MVCCHPSSWKGSLPRQSRVFFAIWVFFVLSAAYIRTACWHDHQTCNWGEALIKAFQNQVGFDIVRSHCGPPCPPEVTVFSERARLLLGLTFTSGDQVIRWKPGRSRKPGAGTPRRSGWQLRLSATNRASLPPPTKALLPLSPLRTAP